MTVSSHSTPLSARHHGRRSIDWSPLLVLALFVMTFMLTALVSGAAYASSYEAGLCTTNATVSGTSSGGTTAQDSICITMLLLREIFQGDTGQAIAALAITILGFAAGFGKISWTQAMVVVTGVAMIFGADSLIAALQPDQANQTAGSDPISVVLSNMTNELTGLVGQTIASVVVIILGVGALLGKLSWSQAFALIGGIGLIFGSLNIVNTLNPGPNLVFDGSNDPVSHGFETIIADMTGETGVSVATAAVMAMGFAAMIGKLSWVRALLLTSGIALMFGAADVVGILMNSLQPCAAPQSSDDFTFVICAFMNELQGPIGKTFGTLAVIIVGVLAMLGKISWELGFTVAIGLALVFGANAIVEIIEANTSGNYCDATPPSAPSTGNAIGDVLCYLVMILYGPAGKALATVAVIMMGFGALMGKVSYSQAFIVAVGIAVTFGAQTITGIMLPSASTTGCTLQTSTGGSSTC